MTQSMVTMQHEGWSRASLSSTEFSCVELKYFSSVEELIGDQFGGAQFRRAQVSSLELSSVKSS